MAALIGILAFLTDNQLASALLVLALVIIFGTGNGALPTVATTVFLHADRMHQDRASAIYVVTYQVGIASGSALGAVAVDLGFPPGTLLLMALLAAGAFLVFFFLSRPRLS